ncbi:hypothetical protein N8482_01975 [Chitinophagales bacterium]|nr:hypothetical protein [Chitinophagales bacterium]
MHFIKQVAAMLLIILGLQLCAQGPPVTTDKAIMLAPTTFVLKTLVEHRFTEEGNFTRIPLMVHYLPAGNLLVSAHLPFVRHSFSEESDERNGWELGDVQLLAKYQFFRKDRKGKTTRMALKSLQSFPTGKKYGIHEMSTGNYEIYLGAVLGYETLKHGIGCELGYAYTPSENQGELKANVGFGLPLLKPVYPVKQINLYFEYKSFWLTEQEEGAILYAQSIQYAINQYTIELGYQWPLAQDLTNERTGSLFFGTRYIF